MRQLTHKFARENQSFCYINADCCAYADKTIRIFLLLIYKKEKIVIIKNTEDNFETEFSSTP